MSYRLPKGAWIGGVAHAVARKFGLNVIAVRLVALVALAIYPLAVGAVYLLSAWILRQPGGLQRVMRSGSVSPRRPEPAGAAKAGPRDPLRNRMQDLESRLAEIEAEIVASEMDEVRRS